MTEWLSDREDLVGREDNRSKESVVYFEAKHLAAPALLLPAQMLLRVACRGQGCVLRAGG